MKNYFENCNSQEEAKKIYRQLSMKYHPDMGGNNDDFIELNRQYKEFLNKSIHNQAQSEQVFNEDFEEMLEKAFSLLLSKYPKAALLISVLGKEKAMNTLRSMIQSRHKRYGMHTASKRG